MRPGRNRPADTPVLHRPQVRVADGDVHATTRRGREVHRERIAREYEWFCDERGRMRTVVLGAVGEEAVLKVDGAYAACDYSTSPCL